MTPFFITVNYGSSCPEIGGDAPNAHAADIFGKAYAAMQSLVENESKTLRFPCGCHAGTAKIEAGLSKAFEDQYQAIMRTRRRK